MLDPLGYVCRFRALRAHQRIQQWRVSKRRMVDTTTATATAPPPRSCVEDWRSKWHDSAQPFLFVQLPPGGGPHFVALRAAQASQAGFGVSGIRRKWDSP